MRRKALICARVQVSKAMSAKHDDLTAGVRLVD